MKIEGRKTIVRELVFTISDKWETDIILRALRRDRQYQNLHGNNSETIMVDNMIQQLLTAIAEYR